MLLRSFAIRLGVGLSVLSLAACQTQPGPPAHLASAEDNSRIEHCEHPIGLVSLAPPDDTTLERLESLELGSPLPFLRTAMFWSNCFQVVDLEDIAASELADQPHFAIRPQITLSNPDAGSVGGVGSLTEIFDPSSTQEASGNVKVQEAKAVLFLSDARTGLLRLAAEGSATAHDLSDLPLGGDFGELGGDQKTAGGELFAAAFLDALNDLVIQIRSPQPTITQSPQPTVTQSPQPMVTAEHALRELPHFPWPPPAASAREIIPAALVDSPGGARKTLWDIANALTNALRKAGHSEYSFYRVQGGFALVTRLEQIAEDGTPLDPPHRWASKVPPIEDFSLKDYLKALFFARPGYYRVIAFVVTDHPIEQSEQGLSRQAAERFVRRGTQFLPMDARQVPLARRRIVALIYEFQRSSPGRDTFLQRPGRLSGRTHLEKGRIWAALE